jgi:hypothetical protein
MAAVSESRYRKVLCLVRADDEYLGPATWGIRTSRALSGGCGAQRLAQQGSAVSCMSRDDELRKSLICRPFFAQTAGICTIRTITPIPGRSESFDEPTRVPTRAAGRA